MTTARHARRLGSLTLLGLLLALPGAAAEPQLEVTPNRDLDPAGATVTAEGSGYDMTKGIYVAWCVVPPPGQAPSPCGGGQDQSGESGQSVWVSSNPPPYGIGLAQPYGPGGTFRVELQVSRYIGEDVDCFAVACAVVTRNDHTRSSDRSQDVFAPVTFTGQEDAAAPAPPPPAPASPPPAPAPAPPPPAPPPPAPAPPAPAPAPAAPPPAAPAPAAPGPAPNVAPSQQQATPLPAGTYPLADASPRPSDRSSFPPSGEPLRTLEPVLDDPGMSASAPTASGIAVSGEPGRGPLIAVGSALVALTASGLGAFAWRRRGGGQ